MARRFDCHVTALNLSTVENLRNRELNEELGHCHQIEVIEGSFEEAPYGNETFDVVWSQDAILHSGDCAKVLREVSRLLKPGGEFIFTDPMQTDDCPAGVIEQILARIHLSSLGSPAFYTKATADVGLDLVAYHDMSEQLVNHYSAVLREIQHQEQALISKVSRQYIEKMKKGLQFWIDGGKKRYLAWGIFHFKKT